MDEQFPRLQLVTSQHTAEEGLQKQFDDFLDHIQPATKATDQKVKEKFLESSLCQGGAKFAFDISAVDLMEKVIEELERKL